MEDPFYDNDKNARLRRARTIGARTGAVGAHTYQPAPIVHTKTKWSSWRIFCRIVTIWAPDFILKPFYKTSQVRQAWREKITLFSIAVLMWAFVAFYTVYMRTLMCPSSKQRDLDTFLKFDGRGDTLGIQGWHYNISQSLIPRTGPNFYTFATAHAGQDITPFFRQPSPASCANTKYAAGNQTMCVYGNGFRGCPLGQLGNATYSRFKIFNATKLVGFDWSQIQLLTNAVVLDGVVLNMDVYLNLNKEPKEGDIVDAAIRSSLRQGAGPGGRDMTRLFNGHVELRKEIQCLKDKYVQGYIDKDPTGCFFSSLLLYITIVVLGMITLTRFAMACVYSWFLSYRLAGTPKGERTPFGQEKGASPWTTKSLNTYEMKNNANSTMTPLREKKFTAGGPWSTATAMLTQTHTICLVTAYSEGEEGLRGTLTSLAETEYADERKLIWVVCDGIVKGKGESKSTPDHALSLIDLDMDDFDDEPKQYVAVGSEANAVNRAKVYCGYFTKSRGHQTPVIVVVKSGASEKEETSSSKPGNRGKRDSQMILMNFLNRVLFNDRMTPLDYDLFRKITHLMGTTPDCFEHLLMVDADTTVHRRSLQLLVNCMLNDPLIMGVCGETKIANKTESWVTWIQVFEYYISHHLGKGFESVFGGVTCLPGCFSMYRLKVLKPDYEGQEKWVPILTKPEILTEYSESIVETLHEKNLLLLGEDRFLSTLMLRHFPNRKMMFCRHATCKTVIPNSIRVLLSQRRRWINSTIHNLMELMLVRNLCGTFCFSMQFVVMMELVGTVVLPAALILMGYLTVVQVLQPATNFVDAIPLVMMVVTFLLPAILILLTTRKILYLFWMVIYLFALPVWSILLPVYSFWKMNDFTWGETRKVVGDKGHEVVDPVGAILVDQVPLKTWETWESARLKKALEDKKKLATKPKPYVLQNSQSDLQANQYSDMYSTSDQTPDTNTVLNEGFDFGFSQSNSILQPSSSVLPRETYPQPSYDSYNNDNFYAQNLQPNDDDTQPLTSDHKTQPLLVGRKASIDRFGSDNSSYGQKNNYYGNRRNLTPQYSSRNEAQSTANTNLQGSNSSYSPFVSQAYSSYDRQYSGDAYNNNYPAQQPSQFDSGRNFSETPSHRFGRSNMPYREPNSITYNDQGYSQGPKTFRGGPSASHAPNSYNQSQRFPQSNTYQQPPSNQRYQGSNVNTSYNQDRPNQRYYSNHRPNRQY